MRDNIKTGYCDFPGCDRIEDRGGFCFLHAVHFAGAKPDKKKKPIAKVSEKRKAENKEYKKIVKEKIKDDNRCKVGAPGCLKIADGLHHLQKRSPNNLTNKDNCVPCCSNCNRWIEENSSEAKRLGLTVSRFKKETAK